MKYRRIPIILFTLLLGCSESEQPLNENEELAVVDSIAPTPEVGTVRLKTVSNVTIFWDGFRKNKLLILPGEDTQMITNIGTPTVVYRVIDGKLTKQEAIFQKEIYHLLWCHLDDKIVLVNILEQQIPYISYDDGIAGMIDQETGKYEAEVFKRYEEIAAEELKIWKAWAEGREEITPEEARSWEDKAHLRWFREFSIQPFFIRTGEDFGDEIEVIIQHAFKYQIQDKEMEMLFVRVLRNLTRPHITFPQPLFP